MKKDVLEKIKVVCFLVIAVSLAIIAWKSITQVNELQQIKEEIYQLGTRVSQLNG
ncbi:hypothetical protein [Bacillus sp. FJAT-49736]|uniref:hypothetical protein n=1 Tax=Bacillus sp. FJAT-49736 TaxID=2833582 RepID=UPI001BC8CF9F|nr:hypothetical protein [Bacillus sp. FJAT-49736]MBS4172694.1 hypothetical protein [Bacillus sp. FJAT-49736]